MATITRTDPEQIGAPIPAAGSRPRRPHPRPTLPSGRAVLGGLLVSLSALGALVVAGWGDQGPDASYVVAVDELVPGRPIDASMVELQPQSLSADVAASAFTDVGALEGLSPLAPVRPGELLQRGTIRLEPSPGSGADQLSLAVARHRALNGEIQIGERVDLLGTDGSGESASTRVIAVGALVVGVEDGVDAVGATGEITVLLALDSPETVLAAAHAAAVAEITLTRSAATEAAPGTAELELSPEGSPP